MKITGTFFQPLASGEIPTMNWRTREWDAEMALMKRAGIDTIILLQMGIVSEHSRPWMAYDSEFLKKNEQAFPADFDYVDMFLRLAEKYGMKMFVPLYSPWHDWQFDSYVPKAEFEFLRPLVDEVWERYGSYKAFAGWYFPQELSGGDCYRVCEMWQYLTPYCKSLSGDIPVMVSPYMRGIKALSISVPYEKRLAYSVNAEQHREQWDMMMGLMEGCVDIIAFQDGHVDFPEMPEFLRINVELAEKHHLECWSNVESFSRDSTALPPLKWEKLRYKMEAAIQAGHSKLITYEWMPFLSPNGPYLQTRGLFSRYCEWAGLNEEDVLHG